jgi:hypothetical protein
MKNEEWIALFQRIPPDQHSTLILVCQTGSEIALEAIFRTEPTFLVLRGRTAGTTDEGRLFFIPYNQLTYLRIERVVAEREVPGLLGESPPPEPVAAEAAPAAEATPPPDDPSAVAKNNLLAKIRAARAAVTSQPPPK